MNTPLAAELIAALAGGAIIGSFLSVLAVRIPRILLADGDAGPRLRQILSGISWPGSHCTACHASLRWYDNIPVLSYLLLHGKCRACNVRYGSAYILLECVTGLTAALCVVEFGWAGEALLCFTLLSSLITLAMIDWKEQLLPDVLVIPLLPLGLLFQARFRDGLTSGVMGMAMGYLVMWTIAALYRLGTGRDGMGFGDVKMAGVLGAWLGAAAVPFFLVGAFASGVVATVPLLLVGRLRARIAVPFGPFLSLSAVFFLFLPSAAKWAEGAIFGL